MAEERKFTVNKSNNAKRDKSLLPVLVILIAVAMIGILPMVYYSQNTYKFNSFLDDARESFVNAQKFNGFTATYQNETRQIDNDSGSWIFTVLSMIGRGIGCDEEEAINPFVLDFGDGTTMLLSESEMKGRYQNTVGALYVEYTYSNGKKYCYKTDETSFNYLLESIIKYYFPHE
ncbi:MAG: hypothetical protein J6H21_04375 [Firmicutes bacterium]|nr:hypothetical protein [Bacillota bacterium]